MNSSSFPRALLAMGAATILSATATGCLMVSVAAMGTWTDDSSGAELTFTQEGLITGTDGCNETSGTWQEHGDDVVLTLTVGDDEQCPGHDEWLAESTQAHVDGDTMQLFGANNNHLGDLDRQ